MAFFGFAMLAFFLITVTLLFSALTYISAALFLNNISKDYHVEGRWAAWIPFVSNFYFSKLVGITSGDKSFFIAYVVTYVFYFIVAIFSLFFHESDIRLVVMLILCLVGASFVILNLVGIHRLVALYHPHHATLFTFLILVPFVNAVILAYLAVFKVGKGKLKEKNEKHDLNWARLIRICSMMLRQLST